MKILVNAVSAKLGGAATYIRNLAGSLLEQARPGEEFVFVVPPERAREIPATDSRLRVVADGAAGGSYARRLWWDQVGLRRMLEREQPDVLFSSANFALLACPCPQVLLVRIPIYFSREYLQQVLPGKSASFRAETALRRWLVCRSVGAADCVVTPSAAMLEDLRQFVKLDESHARVNSYGVPRARLAQQIARLKSARGEQTVPRPARILWVSHYADHKNLATLLRAAEILKQQNVSFELQLTLDPWRQDGQHTRMPQEELDLLRRLDGTVRTIGVLDYDATWRAYEQVDIFVFPSLCESFGHPLVEAMAAGLPVVASDIAVHREICGNAGSYFPVLDAQALAAQLGALIRNPALRQELAARGSHRVEQFLWEDHVDRLLGLLREMAASRAARGPARRTGRKAVPQIS
ncbi:MAG: glycosyltransferase family 4 protein [Acidipila sp.]|nr:glycosyltransferase family 4 protein [Acidipila sp.]